MTGGPVVPSSGLDAWGVLTAALEAYGPAPCEESPLPEAWWAEGQLLEMAQACCRGCPVRAECLAYAVAADERAGLWGGLTAAERAR